ncbi:MAG: nucleotide exchange factor GrpE [Acidobacteria bacterium]|nr:nucleotide exchange factor GrpE [Acidobacteriota bacterium]
MNDNLENQESEQAQTGADQESAAGDATSSASVAEETIRQLREDNRQTTEQMLRKVAEFDNIRKRMAKEKEEFLQYSLFATLESLLPVLDGFGMAIKSPGEGENYRKGIEIIYQQFLTTLQRLGIEPIETKDQFFDPNLHEAVAAVETETYEDQQIVDELQPGFMYKQRLLRAARVRVAHNPKSGAVRNSGEGRVDDSGDETILILD